VKTIAALCVGRKSIYKSIEGVDAYDIDRDARTFAGGMPIVGHPPCRAWSAFCRHQAKPMEGEKDLAVFVVDKLRECGGVLEHPAWSMLWDELELPKPGEPERYGLWSMAVNQSWFGDSRIKRTWLLFSGIEPSAVEVPFALNPIGNCRNQWNTMSKDKRASTPVAFATWLVNLARLSCVLREASGDE